jgi:Transglycosylase-like domain
MRKRALLFAAPLCIVAIVASVAAASPSDAEHSRGPKLDKLHVERPIAASNRTAHTTKSKASFEAQAKAIQDYVAMRTVGDYIVTRMIQDYIAFRAAEEAAVVSEPVSEPVSSSVYSSSNPGDFLSCVRNRESGGNYGIYNEGGSGAAGAYQFLPGTWNSIAASVGRGDLVGIDPAQAAPTDQDAMAQALYAQQGAAPWGGGC